MTRANKKDRKWMINIVKRHNNNRVKVKELVDYVKKNGGISYAQTALNNYTEKAIELLHEFQPSQARESIEHLVHFVISRNK